jgi:hypothetical protein
MISIHVCRTWMHHDRHFTRVREVLILDGMNEAIETTQRGQR